ncbi:MAG: NfeD family protein [Defluviitaleaceae bacterium]|nr:NfeD family protein [Defluviitaleaceae bacterium]
MSLIHNTKEKLPPHNSPVEMLLRVAKDLKTPEYVISWRDTVNYWLSGLEGTVIQYCRPAGSAEFDCLPGVHIDVTAFNSLISVGERVKILKIQSNVIYVEKGSG